MAKTYRSRHADATSAMAPGSDILSEMSGLPPKRPVNLARAKGELLTLFGRQSRYDCSALLQQPCPAQAVVEMFEVGFVLLLRGPVPIGFPRSQLSPGEHVHLLFSDVQELLEHGARLVQPPRLGITCGEPATDLVDR